MNVLIGITGASGVIYAKRLLKRLVGKGHDISVVYSKYAKVVIKEELGGDLEYLDGVKEFGPSSMHVPFASGSNVPDVMVVIPCSMGTLGRIAHGYSQDAMARGADVVLKEKRRLIVVPRETPLNLIHIKNLEILQLAGAHIIPASPSFYSMPTTIEELVDTVVARVLDNMGISQNFVPKWQDDIEDRANQSN